MLPRLGPRISRRPAVWLQPGDHEAGGQHGEHDEHRRGRDVHRGEAVPHRPAGGQAVRLEIWVQSALNKLPLSHIVCTVSSSSSSSSSRR